MLAHVSTMILSKRNWQLAHPWPPNFVHVLYITKIDKGVDPIFCTTLTCTFCFAKSRQPSTAVCIILHQILYCMSELAVCIKTSFRHGREYNAMIISCCPKLLHNLKYLYIKKDIYCTVLSSEGIIVNDIVCKCGKLEAQSPAYQW